jgi:hypothetical protein
VTWKPSATATCGVHPYVRGWPKAAFSLSGRCSEEAADEQSAAARAGPEASRRRRPGDFPCRSRRGISGGRFAADILRQVGNYAESYDRHLTPLGLDPLLRRPGPPDPGGTSASSGSGSGSWNGHPVPMPCSCVALRPYCATTPLTNHVTLPRLLPPSQKNPPRLRSVIRCGVGRVALDTVSVREMPLMPPYVPLCAVCALQCL